MYSLLVNILFVITAAMRSIDKEEDSEPFN